MDPAIEVATKQCRGDGDTEPPFEFKPSADQMKKIQNLCAFLKIDSTEEALMVAVEWYPKMCKSLTHIMAEYKIVADGYCEFCRFLKDIGRKGNEIMSLLQQSSKIECAKINPDLPHFGSDLSEVCKGRCGVSEVLVPFLPELDEYASK